MHYFINVHRDKVRFSVRTKVVTELRLSPGDRIFLRIRNFYTKRVLRAGTFILKSGTEIYGEGLEHFLSVGQKIAVEATRSRRR